MKLSYLCIQKPVFATVLSLVLVLAGWIAFTQLPVRFAPLYFRPTLMVSAYAPGASAQYSEQNLTQPLEQVLASTPGLDEMISRSQQGQTNIFLNFQNLTPEKFVMAESQVMQEVGEANLPSNQNRPQVFQHSQQNLTMALGISDPSLPMVDLVNYANNTLFPRLQQVKGVASVDVDADTPTLRVEVDPQKMASLGIGVDQVESVLEESNASYPLGQLFTSEQSILLNSNMNVPDLTHFNQLVLSKKGSRLIHLSDIAQLLIGWSTASNWYGYVNGQPGFDIQIQTTDDANPIQVGSDIRALLKQMKPSFPSGLTVTPVFDLSQPLKQAIHEVYFTLFIAIMLVTLITLAFLGNARAMLIPIVTIPVCLIASFAIMLLLGFTINVMTLLALVLAVGLVVDDAIVMLENTYRHIELDAPPLAAAMASVSEISFPIIGMTLSLVSVYLPALFMPANIDTTYFQEFSFTLAGAILISGFLALTLSPMMCARLLQKGNEHPYQKRLKTGLHRLSDLYARCLNQVLLHPKTVFSLVLLNIVIGLIFFHLLPTNLLPRSEIDYLFGALSGPNSANADYLDQQVAPFRHQMESNPELKNTLFFITPQNQIYFFTQVKQAGDRDQIAAQLNAEIASIPTLSGGVSVVNVNGSIGSSHPGSLFFYVTGFAHYQTIAHAVASLQKALAGKPGFATVIDNTQFDQPEYNLVIHRNLVTQLGVNIGTLNDTLSTFLGGYQLPNSTYQLNGYGYPIVVQLSKNALTSLAVLQTLYVQNNQGANLPVSSLVEITPSIDLSTRLHVNQLRAGELDVNLMPHYAVGQAMKEIQAVAAHTLPNHLSIAWGGEMRNLLQNNTSGNLFIVLGLALIYLVLAALFESFIDPLIILCTVPLCMVAGLIALHVIHGSINIYTKIALVTLIGLVSKHGVLLTQFANQRCQEGMDALQAVKEAARIRFRPIFMTSLTMILGALPLVFAFGTDAQGRREIGMIIVFGLLFGSVFSLFIVPVAYCLLSSMKNRFRYTMIQKR